jgi:ParB family transcriptional regulator, chromosome partitioning protein
MGKRTGLGQGVHLLFEEEQERYFECDIHKISPNKYQPRSNFSEGALHELALSIKEQGVIQPLIVRVASDDTYELIAGERRLRAAKLAGLSTVPVVRIDVDDEKSLLELALIENIQRTDLNAIEEAEAYQNLIERFGHTQDETAKRVGKNRSTVANILRLLKLPTNLQTDVRTGVLSEGHGRALVRLIDNPMQLQEVRNMVVEGGLSVRQTEKLIKKAGLSPRPKKEIKREKSDEIPASYRNALLTQLTNRLHAKVQIHHQGGRGKIEIDYYSLDDLDRLTTLLLGED